MAQEGEADMNPSRFPCESSWFQQRQELGGHADQCVR
jgi:hypothetical protein